MSTPKVEENRAAGIYLFRYHQEGMTIRVDRLTEDKKSLWAELYIEGHLSVFPRWGHIHHEGFNLLSGVTKKQLSTRLAVLAPYEHIKWAEVIEQVCLGVIQRHRKGEPAVLIGDVVIPESLSWRLEPLLAEKSPTLIYGFGGTGKSYLPHSWRHW